MGKGAFFQLFSQIMISKSSVPAITLVNWQNKVEKCQSLVCWLHFASSSFKNVHFSHLRTYKISTGIRWQQKFQEAVSSVSFRITSNFCCVNISTNRTSWWREPKSDSETGVPLQFQVALHGPKDGLKRISAEKVRTEWTAEALRSILCMWDSSYTCYYSNEKWRWSHMTSCCNSKSHAQWTIIRQGTVAWWSFTERETQSCNWKSSDSIFI